MAIIDHKGAVRGTAGSVVYRRYRNKNIIQGKPRKFKQTPESVRASTEFGLSSSAAAVIRRGFEPAFIFRDGEAVARTTKQVYQALRSSLTGSIGERDLHDADLQQLVGMDFNGNSKLAEVLQIPHELKRDEEGNILVTIGRFHPAKDVKKAAGYAASRYRIRLMAVAFDFRQEYLEYLDMQDVDFKKYDVMPEQTIRLKAQADPGCMVLVSMSLLMYGEMGQTHEYVLLNNKGFSPCAIIAAYPADEPSPKDASPVDVCQAVFPTRFNNMEGMGYAGNTLLREFARTGFCKKPLVNKKPVTEVRRMPELRKKVAF
ncbi:MAG: hypothetical protein ACO1NU_04095 [Arcticibacter sp.]